MMLAAALGPVAAVALPPPSAAAAGAGGVQEGPFDALQRQLREADRVLTRGLRKAQTAVVDGVLSIAPPLQTDVRAPLLQLQAQSQGGPLQTGAPTEGISRASMHADNTIFICTSTCMPASYIKSFASCMSSVKQSLIQIKQVRAAAV